MQLTLHFKSHFLLSKHVLLLNPLVRTNTFLRGTNLAPKFPSIDPSLTLSARTHVQRRVICAKKKKRRPGSQRSRKFMLQLISVLASNLNILPQPLDFVIQEFTGGEGGVLRFLKVYGGGGFGWWRRRQKGSSWFIMLLVISISLFLLNGRELNGNVISGILGLSSFVSVFVKGFRRNNVKDWLFGLCFLGALMGLGWNRQKAMKWVDESRVCSPMVEIFARGKRKGRRAV